MIRAGGGPTGSSTATKVVNHLVIQDLMRSDRFLFCVTKWATNNIIRRRLSLTPYFGQLDFG